VPLVRQAWSLGFDVTVVDPRGAYLRPDLFPGARLVVAGFDALERAVVRSRGGYAVVMSHHMERDRQALRFCLEGDPAYVGVLGPRARFERMLADLAREGFVPPPAVVGRVRSPVGLSLGAETPEEVAVAIAAELVAIRHGFEGGFLTGSTASLHRSAATLPLARS
jgi:xanthine/CO dehydrogenase XdhC/CoxF family maturation factor